jgi:hypothetical protein
MNRNSRLTAQSTVFIGPKEGSSSVGLFLARLWQRRRLHRRVRGASRSLQATATQPQWSLVQVARRVLFPPLWVELARAHVLAKFSRAFEQVPRKRRDGTAAPAAVSTAVEAAAAPSPSRNAARGGQGVSRTQLLGRIVFEWVDYDQRRLVCARQTADGVPVVDPRCSAIPRTERLRNKWRRLRELSAASSEREAADGAGPQTDNVALVGAPAGPPPVESPTEQYAVVKLESGPGTLHEDTEEDATLERCAGPALARCWSAPELGDAEDDSTRYEPERSPLDYLGNVPLLFTTNTPQGRLLQRRLRVARLQMHRLVREGVRTLMQSAPLRLALGARLCCLDGAAAYESQREARQVTSGPVRDASPAAWKRLSGDGVLRSVSQAALATLGTLRCEWPFHVRRLRDQ